MGAQAAYLKMREHQPEAPEGNAGTALGEERLDGGIVIEEEFVQNHSPWAKLVVVVEEEQETIMVSISMFELRLWRHQRQNNMVNATAIGTCMPINVWSARWRCAARSSQKSVGSCVMSCLMLAILLSKIRRCSAARKQTL